MQVGTLHYRCGFFVRPSRKNQQINLWQELLNQVRSWAAYQPRAHRLPINGMYDKWFENGGSEHFGPFFIITAYAEEYERKNRVWALLHEQPDRDYPFRKWYTYIGLFENQSADIFFQVQTTYNIDANYLGEMPPTPVPTTPNIVKRILTSSTMISYSGNAEFSGNATLLHLGDGDRFRSHLDDLARSCPVILITPVKESGNYLVDPEKLAKRLQGAAQVFVLPPKNNDILDEFRVMLGRKLFTYDGAVRLYLQGVDNNSPTASFRHRFVTGKKLLQLGQEDAEKLFADAVLRKNLSYHSNYPLSPDEVISFFRKQRIIELKNRKKGEASSIDEIQQFNEMLWKDNDDLQKRVDELEGKIGELQGKCEEYEGQESRLNSKIENLQHQLTEKKQHHPQVTADKCFYNYPNSLEMALHWFQKLFPGHIVFTADAMENLADSTFKDTETFWNTLVTMHTFLWDWCIAGKRQGNIEQEFERLSGRRLDCVVNSLKSRRQYI